MATPQPRYTVVNVTETSVPTPDNRIRRVTLIRFRLANGHDGVLEVPEQGLSPQRAKELLEVEVARLEAIYRLS